MVIVNDHTTRNEVMVDFQHHLQHKKCETTEMQQSQWQKG